MHLAATTSTEHFSIIVAILVGIVGMLSTLLKGAWTFFAGINAQLEAIKINSEAISRMNTRMDRIEQKLEALPSRLSA